MKTATIFAAKVITLSLITINLVASTNTTHTNFDKVEAQFKTEQAMPSMASKTQSMVLSYMDQLSYKANYSAILKTPESNDYRLVNNYGFTRFESLSIDFMKADFGLKTLSAFSFAVMGFGAYSLYRRKEEDFKEKVNELKNEFNPATHIKRLWNKIMASIKASIKAIYDTVAKFFKTAAKAAKAIKVEAAKIAKAAEVKTTSTFSKVTGFISAAFTSKKNESNNVIILGA